MRHVILGIAALLVFVSCERDIPIVDPAALDNRNVHIRLYKYFGNEVLDTGKVYMINGDVIKLDHLYMTFSHAEFISANEEDTVRTESDLTMVDVLTTERMKLAYLPRGSYNGQIDYHIGLDSARAFTPPTALEATNPLSSGDVWNGQAFGHSFFQLEGRVFDAGDTTFTTPKNTFSWRLATPDLALKRTEKRNFNISENGDVVFIVDFDIDKLFVGLSPSAMPEISSDAGNSADYFLAQVLRDNLQSEFVFKL